MIITSFNPQENNILQRALRTLDCQIVINKVNPYAKKLYTESDYPKQDGFVTVVKNKNKAFPDDRLVSISQSPKL